MQVGGDVYFIATLAYIWYNYIHASLHSTDAHSYLHMYMQAGDDVYVIATDDALQLPEDDAGGWACVTASV